MSVMHGLIECHRENKEIILSVECRVYEPLYDKERGKLQRRIVEVSVIYTLLHNTFVKTILAAS